MANDTPRRNLTPELLKAKREQQRIESVRAVMQALDEVGYAKKDTTKAKDSTGKKNKSVVKAKSIKAHEDEDDAANPLNNLSKEQQKKALHQTTELQNTIGELVQTAGIEFATVLVNDIVLKGDKDTAVPDAQPGGSARQRKGRKTSEDGEEKTRGKRPRTA